MDITNNTELYDIYELMITPPNKKGEMIVSELMKKNPNLNLVSDLIELGANLDWQDNLGWSALFFCAAWAHFDIARMLVDAGADVNMQDENGLTLLHWSVYANDQNIARILIEAGADVGIRSCNGNTILDWCERYNRLEIEIMMLQDQTKNS